MNPFLLKTNQGFSLVQVMICLGVISLIGMSSTSMMQNTMSQQRRVERRVAASGVDQAIRNLFVAKAACGCNFKLSIPEVGPISVPEISYYADESCEPATAKKFLKPTESIFGTPDLKVASLKLTNLSTTGSSAKADLEISYTPPTHGSQIKNTVIAGMILETNGTAVMAPTRITGCIAAPGIAIADDKPIPCGHGMVCWKGKSIRFSDQNNNVISSGILSNNSLGGFSVGFHTPNGRAAMLNFAEVGGVLVASKPLGWMPQLCYMHNFPVASLAHACATGGDYESAPNCGSGIYWSGDYTGNSTTLSGYTACPGP